MYKPGTRVIAMSHSEGDTLYIFGYGVYEGDFLPPYVNVAEQMDYCRANYPGMREEDPSLPEEIDETKLHEAMQFALGNPRIKLDNGKIVWGFECWWGDVGGFEGSTEKGTHKNIVEIDIDEARAQNSKTL